VLVVVFLIVEENFGLAAVSPFMSSDALEQRQETVNPCTRVSGGYERFWAQRAVQTAWGGESGCLWLWIRDSGGRDAVVAVNRNFFADSA